MFLIFVETRSSGLKKNAMEKKRC